MHYGHGATERPAFDSNNGKTFLLQFQLDGGFGQRSDSQPGNCQTLDRIGSPEVHQHVDADLLLVDPMIDEGAGIGT